MQAKKENARRKSVAEIERMDIIEKACMRKNVRALTGKKDMLMSSIHQLQGRDTDITGRKNISEM